MSKDLKELCAGFAKALLKAKNEADEEKEKTALNERYTICYIKEKIHPFG